jgi:UDP-N-acetylglucosamine 2-epimerase (hydrolysing)
MKNKKKILFITGTRADYGKLKSLMKKIEGSFDFELFIFIGGMHLVKVFGSTYEEVLKEGYKNVYVAHGLRQSSCASINFGDTVSHIAGYVKNIMPDMIVVHGDRVEALAGAVVGALNNVAVAHIEGGEVSGTIDESIRHAVSKFANLHFVSNEEAKKRIIQLGEKEEDIFVIGSPDIDVMLSDTLPSLDKVKKRYGIDFCEYGIVMYHPVTTENHETGDKIKIIVDSLIKSNKKYIIIYPNNDLGSEIILNEYSRFRDNKNFLLYPSMRFEYFLTLLKYAKFIIGNSSAGIMESGIYGIPTINIGTRQNGRFNLVDLKNIQQVNENVDEILKAIYNISKYSIKNMHFGKGDSTQRFIKTISDSKIWKRNLQKKFVDIE